MSCTPIREQLPGLLYGDLGPDESAAVREHLDRCPACREEWASLRRLCRMLDAAPVEAAPVNLPAVYQEAARRKEGQVRRWRRATVVLLAAAAVLLLGLLLNLEVRLEGHQLVVRWGALPEPPPRPQPVVAVAPPPVTAEELELVKDLIHALAADAQARDGRQKEALARLQERLDVLQHQADERWAVTKLNERAFYTALFGPREKGAKQ